MCTGAGIVGIFFIIRDISFFIAIVIVIFVGTAYPVLQLQVVSNSYKYCSVLCM